MDEEALRSTILRKGDHYMEITFPPTFLWGTATAAHQVEGGNVYNDTWAMEHATGSAFVESSGDACDHYHRYREDIALLADLGFTLYRFSLEWSRIEPEEGEFPLACTLNEVNGGPLIKAIAGEIMGSMRKAPWFEAAARSVGSDASRFVPMMFADSERGRETTLAAHRRAVEAIKAGRGKCEVGLTLAMQDIQAGPGGEEMAAQMRRELLDVYLEGTRGDDFIGVQTYSRQRFGPAGPLGPEEGVERTQMDYEFWPEALEAAIRYASAMTGMPVIVTENGIATDDDTRRIAYIERALRGVAACLRDGIDVRGYTYWSALDNFEWLLGYRPTFGLIAVNRHTQERTVKPSARRLGSIARAHGF